MKLKSSLPCSQQQVPEEKSQTSMASFHIVSNSLFINHPTTGRYGVWDGDEGTKTNNQMKRENPRVRLPALKHNQPLIQY